MTRRIEESLRFADWLCQLPVIYGNFRLEKGQRSPYRTHICLPEAVLRVGETHSAAMSPLLLFPRLWESLKEHAVVLRLPVRAHGRMGQQVKVYKSKEIGDGQQ